MLNYAITTKTEHFDNVMPRAVQTAEYEDRAQTESGIEETETGNQYGPLQEAFPVTLSYFVN